MTATKTPTSILKMSTKSPLAGKRSPAGCMKREKFSIQRQTKFQPLPSSLLTLPMHDSCDSSTSSSSTCDIAQKSLMTAMDLELNEPALDEWLSGLTQVTKKAEDERATKAITKAVSKVSFAPSAHTPTQSPTKKRRFARRNSFVVRDIAHLSLMAEQIVNKL